MTINELVQAFIMMCLMAIPFGFQKWIQTNPQLSVANINSRCSRLSIVVIGLMFFALFTESSQTASYAVRHSAFFASIFSFGLLYWFRGKATTSARKVDVSPRDHFVRSARSLGALLFIYGVYALSIRIFSPFITQLPAVVVSLAIIVGLTPIMVRIMFESNRMYDSPLKEDLYSVFKNANISVGEIYLMNTDRFKVSNALVCGSRFGFGPFKRSLFITKNMFEVLEPEELKAVIAHEASHFHLNHIPKRVAYAFAAMVVSAIAVVTPLTFFITVITGKTFQWHTSSTALYVVGSVAVQFFLIHRVIRKQEFEADLHAVVLGATPAALVSALQKITMQNSGTLEKADSLTRFMNNSAHPSFYERREALLTNTIPASAAILPPLKWITSYSAVMLAMFGWVASKDFAPTKTAAVTSEIAQPASPKDASAEIRPSAPTFGDQAPKIVVGRTIASDSQE